MDGNRTGRNLFLVISVDELQCNLFPPDFQMNVTKELISWILLQLSRYEQQAAFFKTLLDFSSPLLVLNTSLGQKLDS